MKTNKTLALLSALAVLAGSAVTARADTSGLNFDFKANAAAYTTSPGENGTAGNAATIQSWLGYTTEAGKGLNGAGTTAGDANGPTAPGGRTYAFVTGGGTAIYQVLTGAGLSGYPANTTYQLNIDVAGKAGDVAPKFKVVFADQFPSVWEFSSGDTAATTAGFTHYTYTFTIPAGGITVPIIELWNVSTGGETVDFANLSITPVTSLVMNGDFRMNAGQYATFPGDNGGGGVNPASIANWIGYPNDGGKGINGAQAPHANIFGPVTPIGRTFAFVQGGGTALYQLLSLAVNTTYQLDVDVAGRNGDAAPTFAVKMADGLTPFMDSGDIAANQAGFTHYSYVFTTPATYTGVPNVELWNNSPAGDNTVVFANVSIVARPAAPNLIVNGHFTDASRAVRTWPGYNGNYGQGAFPNVNPEEIPGWLNYFYAVYNMGVGQGVNGWGTSLASNPFGPADADRHTYAILQNGGFNLLGQYLPTLAANTTYQLDYDAAARSGEIALFAVIVDDEAVGEFYNSGNITGDNTRFQHYTTTFTTPATLTGVPTIQLWNQSPGGETVDFANVSLISLPQPARATILSDNYNSADNSDINANLASPRQTGNLATLGYFKQVNGTDTIEIFSNGLKLSRLDNSAADDNNAVLLGGDIKPSEVNNHFRVVCDVALVSTAGGGAGISVRGDATFRGPGHFNCFGLNLEAGGGYQIYDGTVAVASGSVAPAASYHVVIDVTGNVASITVNGMGLPYYTALYTHTIANATPNGDNWITLRNNANDANVSQIVMFDNLVISTVPVATPAPTLLNPTYNSGTQTASFQFNSVAQGFYVLEYSLDLNGPWSTAFNVIGTGGLQTVSGAAPSPATFLRLRVPQP